MGRIHCSSFPPDMPQDTPVPKLHTLTVIICCMLSCSQYSKITKLQPLQYFSMPVAVAVATNILIITYKIMIS